MLTTVGALGCISGSLADDASLVLGDEGITKDFRLNYRGEFEAVFGKGPKREYEWQGVDEGEHRNTLLEGVFTLLERELLARNVKDAKTDAKTLANAQGVWTPNASDKNAEEVHVDPAAVNAAIKQAPTEFQLYIRSLGAEREEQLALTNRLLALPAGERRNLTALAHYRRARLTTLMTDWGAMEDEPTKARLREIRADYEAAIAAVDQGTSPDIADTKAYSRGWLAHSRSLILKPAKLVELGEADIGGALRTYLALRAEGHLMGEDSAYHIARALAQEYELRSLCANDRDLRRLITVYHCASGNRNIGDEQNDLRAWGREWLKAIVDAKVDIAEDAVRIALLQYNCGAYADCEKTLVLCAEDDSVAALLRSRILLRQGKTAAAAAALRAAAKNGPIEPAAPHWVGCDTDYSSANLSHFHLNRREPNSLPGKVRAELAYMTLGQGDYAEAFRLNALAGLYEDNWYIGECILTIDELKAIIDRDWVTKHEFHSDRYEFPFDITAEFRGLLASRLCRAGRWSEAIAYLSEPAASALRRHIELMARAEDPKVATRDRADAYWRSAVIMQAHGHELLYCHFGERWSGFDGWRMDDWPAGRALGSDTISWNYIAPPSSDEVRRVKGWVAANLNPPYRGHRVMKYEVLRLGLKAVELLPDNDPAGGAILQCIGGQLMYLDPPAANAAYKLLATRFKETPYGRYAAEKHWFKQYFHEERPAFVEPDPEWLKNPPAGEIAPSPPKEER